MNAGILCVGERTLKEEISRIEFQRQALHDVAEETSTRSKTANEVLPSLSLSLPTAPFSNSRYCNSERNREKVERTEK